MVCKVYRVWNYCGNVIVLLRSTYKTESKRMSKTKKKNKIKGMNKMNAFFG